jgi:hypothetical protein
MTDDPRVHFKPHVSSGGTKCGWPRCTAESSQPFTDGWASCTPDYGMAHEWLCPKHSDAYDTLAGRATFYPGEELVVRATAPHQVEYRGEIIKVWQEPRGRWQCCIVATGSQGVHGIGPDEDFDSPEAAIDAAMVMVDEVMAE